MRKLLFLVEDFKLKMKCDYVNSLQVCRGNGIARCSVTVFYDEKDFDMLNLCNECSKYVLQDAERLGLKTIMVRKVERWTTYF